MERAQETHIANGNVPTALRDGLRNYETNDQTSPDNLRDLITDGLRERVQEIRDDVLQRFDHKIDDIVSEIMQKVETAKPAKANGLVNSDKYRDKIKSSSSLLPSKQFLARNSMLTDLFEVPHIRAIHNIFMVIFILLFVNTAVHDIIHTGTLQVGIYSIILAFAKPTVVLKTWICMQTAVLAVYVAFCLWANTRQSFAPNSALRKLWDYGALGSLLFYMTAFSVLSTKEIVDNELPIASSAIILMEQTRMLMKTHAFVRSAAPRFLSYKPHSDQPSPKAPSFSQFFYFLFVPTLVYRDSYPRTKEIRWRVVASNLTEVLMSIFFSAFLFDRFVCPAFENFGTPNYSTKTIILNVFATMGPAMLFFLCGFYCLLHAWMNAFAELLRFADRLFYKDWWNSNTFGGYYRTWNVVVHDWLHTYIYKDMYEIVTPKNKILATFAVFIVSAIFHEYILAFTFGFFYPALLVMFGGLGCSLKFVTAKTGNIFMWLALIVGNGMLVSFYAIEFYARTNCPQYIDGAMDLIVPRSWFCPSETTR